MDVEWVVAVGAAAGLIGWMSAWWRCRRARSQLAYHVASHELTVARLRGELSASRANVTQARTDLELARTAVSEALLDNGRLEQRLVEVGASSVSAADYERAMAERQAAVDELRSLRRELETMTPAVKEIHLYRYYVESLQRELVYRDERLLALEEAERTGPLTSLRSAHRSVNGADSPLPGGGGDDVEIDLTDNGRSAADGARPQPTGAAAPD